VLEGQGKQVRSIRLTNPSRMNEPDVEALISQATSSSIGASRSTGACHDRQDSGGQTEVTAACLKPDLRDEGISAASATSGSVTAAAEVSARMYPM
jgi:hypothetical protein